MANTRDIQRRIRGVKNTGKITRAMEMISAVKMRKATQRVFAIRPYAEKSLAVLRQVVVALQNETHPLLKQREVEAQLYIIVSSNRGLCGAFNTQLFKKLKQELEEAPVETTFIALGKKAENTLRRMNKHILASFPDIIQEASAEQARVISQIAMEEFLSGRVDRVRVIYMDYVSVMSQVVRARTLLPMTVEGAAEQVALIENQKTELSEVSPLASEYIIEPSPQGVLEILVPKLLTMNLYHAVLESKASEESARMMAMRGATDASKEMVADLTLTYNQLRQQKITQEIAELSAGMAAVAK